MVLDDQNVMEVEKTYCFRNRREFWFFCIIPWNIAWFWAERIIPLHCIGQKKKNVREFKICIKKLTRQLMLTLRRSTCKSWKTNFTHYLWACIPIFRDCLLLNASQYFPWAFGLTILNHLAYQNNIFHHLFFMLYIAEKQKM